MRRILNGSCRIQGGLPADHHRLANELVRWTRAEHPLKEVRDALSEPYILPTPEGDPQPNPTGMPEDIQLVEEQFSPQAELNFVANSVEKWLVVKS